MATGRVTKKVLDHIAKINKQNEYLQKLSEWGFKTNPFNKTIKGIKNLLVNYHFLKLKDSDCYRYNLL